MTSAPETLPEDPAKLKAYALSQQREIQRLKLIIAKLQRRQFGRRAETLDPDQLSLLGDRPSVEAPPEEQPPERPASKPKKAARKLLPAHLPREDHRHDVGEQCTCCGGQLRYIGEDVSEMLEYIPARFKVATHPINQIDQLLPWQVELPTVSVEAREAA